ncbi:BnaA02g06330D [Brassica napus]|uniref:BnaA02g06330D protein n=1 Tax=Brassica napus TaxID=3708 RepID=A0A078F7X4_BRANA|nr:BnaA02g06330D [Brassica napus]
MFTLKLFCIYSCGNVNFARRVEYNKCGAPAPSGTGDRGAGRGASDRGGGGRDSGSGSYVQGPPPPLAAIPSYDGFGSYPPPPMGYGMEAVPPPSSYAGGRSPFLWWSHWGLWR